MIAGFAWLRLSYPPKPEEEHDVKMEKLKVQEKISEPEMALNEKWMSYNFTN